jgi:hypothetical protein
MAQVNTLSNDSLKHQKIFLQPISIHQHQITQHLLESIIEILNINNGVITTIRFDSDEQDGSVITI